MKWWIFGLLIVGSGMLAYDLGFHYRTLINALALGLIVGAAVGMLMAWGKE